MPTPRSQPERPLPVDARDAVCRALVGQAKAFPLLNPAVLAVGDLDARESALAHAIHDAVMRRWLTLSFLLESASGRSMGDLEPAIRAVLLSGAAQLVLLDRLPPHAVLDRSVEWAKGHIRPKAGGIVNAILRRVSELVARDEQGTPVRREQWRDLPDEILMGDGSARVLSRAALPDDPRERLSVVSSIPTRVLDRWHESGPHVRARALHALATPPVILNASHAAGALPEGLEPHERAGHHVWTGSHAGLGALMRSRGDVWVQDPSSSASVEMARAKWGEAGGPRVIADVCAGQGTKTRQLAALFPQAEILATDTDAERLAVLQDVFEGHERVRVMSRDSLATQGLGRCDLVLLDVPCSNTGVLARRPEARYRLSPRTLERMGQVQRQIGADAIPLLGARGRVLYATCSLEAEENTLVAAWFTRWHNLRAVTSQSIEPAGLPGEAASGYCDGSFAVLMGR